MLGVLVVLEVGLLHVEEVETFFAFVLFYEYFQIELDKSRVDCKLWLLHEFEKKKVRDVEDLGLELEGERDQVHALNSPLGIFVLLMGLIKVESLILLLKKFTLPNI